VVGHVVAVVVHTIQLTLLRPSREYVITTGLCWMVSFEKKYWVEVKPSCSFRAIFRFRRRDVDISSRRLRHIAASPEGDWVLCEYFIPHHESFASLDKILERPFLDVDLLDKR